MSIHVALNHVTHYRYDRPIHLGPQVVRLRPAPHSRTRVLSYSMRVEPSQHFINWQQDPQSNYLARLVFPDKTSSMRIEVDIVAEMAVLNPFDFFLEPAAEQFPFDYDTALAHELAPYRLTGPLTPRLAAFVAGVPRGKKRTNDFLVELNQRLQREIGYLIRMEPGVQTPEQTLIKASGSCRDSAWLLVQVLRHLGLAARFVSGYLIQLKSDVKALDGPSGTPTDFTDLHAWCEVYLPGGGWIGLDPTSGLLAGEGHIPLACSPDPTSAAPVQGSLEDCETSFEHQMSVVRVWEAPRVTLPYSDAQWASIEQLGEQVDADLQRHDVRLTQGGEPTFVSVDDREGAEWNTEALGPSKRALSADLMERLRAKYGVGGLLHYGQGKWYPGEQLPRWSLNLYWRKDGEPIWSHPEFFASEKRDYGLTEGQAQRFLAGVARRLGLDPRHVFPAYEDAWYYLWRERKLPSNVDPLDARLADPLERERLRKAFSQGLDAVVGHVLPISVCDDSPSAVPRWRSGAWFLRERCYLIPGDSALGYRLPLDSQPWAAKGDLPSIHAADLTQSFPALPTYHALNRAPRSSEGGAGAARTGPQAEAGRVPARHESAAWITRTAISAEPRGGRLYIFMPPISALEDYLELVAALEDTALEMRLPVIVEGYEPPRDPRLATLRVTPDPGVIEVNIHPAHNWGELVDQTTHLYQAAHETRLSTEKFMLDGRHTGTGGGNHFVLGGATVADSPFLRRPDLLASMVAYWHNHPALSYLFSGMFVGPTSQAPRIDEARNDSVYELEIAFAELRRIVAAQGSGGCPPWLVDRLMRNLLVDSTGNTHRAEFCIDKMYSPDGPTGRLGLLEMRAFEMPPHARMSLTQQLLMRCLVARFWQQPYRPAHLKRWGTELHDRFMLPHFIGQDLGDVLEELAQFGYALAADWFAPHLEFRFPRLGEFHACGVEVELRLALEPWHVLGEEGAIGGTARFVDSSLERVQVAVTGLIDERHVLTCNGRRVPLQRTGRVGEFVAGVRYRAWNPPSALHPTIGVHAPLVFDLLDSWMGRSMGGCQYHVAHPGGLSHDTFPVNAFEAEARRLARFFRVGHTPGEMKLPLEPPNPNFPFTLDLRRGAAA
ncbi:MAG: transglutaminase family protein [Burkholderiaceae bacterium]